MMKKYRVVVSYVLAFDLEISAVDEDDARKKAQLMTMNMSNEEFVSKGEPQLANVEVMEYE